MFQAGTVYAVLSKYFENELAGKSKQINHWRVFPTNFASPI